jgi:hypothetical protein
MSLISRAAVRLVICAVAIVGYSYYQQWVGESRATVTYNTAIDQQKLEASATLAREMGRTRAAEQTLQAFKNQQEIDDAKNKRVVGALADQLRAAAGAAGRLRDPNASSAGCGGGGGGAQAADPARAGGGTADLVEAGGFLSADLTELLLSQAKAADDINVAYTSCRLDAFNLREVLK